MKGLLKRGIRSEVVINMTVLAVFAIVLSALVTYKLLERYLILQEVENAKSLTTTVKESIQFTIAREQLLPIATRRFSEAINQYMRLEGVRRIIVTEVRGVVLAQIERGGNLPSEAAQSEMQAAMLRAMVGRETVVRIEDPIGRFFARIPGVEVAVPLLNGDRVWGGLLVRVELQGLFAISPAALRYFAIYMIVVAAVLAAFGSTLMSKLIVEPVLALVAGTRKVSAGDLTTRVSIPVDNEIGELAQSFNIMNERLQAAQSELVRNEKFAMVGRLTAGVAHEIGNPIGAIIGYADILKTGSSSPEQSKDFSERIAQESTRIDRIIRDLLELSAPAKSQAEAVDLNSLITQTVNLVTGQDLFRGIDLLFSPHPENPQVRADVHQLQQVLINLWTNAANAMRSSGTLTVQIKTGRFNEYKDIPIHAGAVREARNDEERAVLIEVADSGPGVNPAIVDQIFDPFVTTMEPGKGTGLGLYIVSNLLETAHATIGCQNSPSGGARFFLLFRRET